MKLVNRHELEWDEVSHNTKIRKQVMLSKGEAGPVTQYARAVFPPGEKAEAHKHDDMLEVFSVESGCGVMVINGVEYGFSAGMTALVEPCEIHEIINTGSEDLILNYFGVQV